MFKCSYDNAKRKFYRAFNAVFGKIWRSASEEVIIQLFKTKCLPVLYYGLEVCPINRDQVRSLDYTQSRAVLEKFSQREITLSLSNVWYFLNATLFMTQWGREKGNS